MINVKTTENLKSLNWRSIRAWKVKRIKENAVFHRRRLERSIKTLNLPGWTACAASRVASPHCASPRRPAPRVSLGRANKSPRMCAAKCVYCTVYKYWAQRSLTSHKFSFGLQFKVFEAYGSSSLPFVNTDFPNELRLRVVWNYFRRVLVGLEGGHSENWWWEPNR